MSLPLPPTANLDTENGDKSWKDRKKPVVINKVSIGIGTETETVMRNVKKIQETWEDSYRDCYDK